MNSSLNETTELRLKSHKPEELVSVAVENSRDIGSKLMAYQTDAIEMRQRFPWNESATDSFMVEVLFHAFDGLFFFGLLKDKFRLVCREEDNKLCGIMLPAKKTVRIRLFMWSSTPEDQEESGWFYPFSTFRITNACNNNPGSPSRLEMISNQTPVILWASTLLHKMVHAFLYLFMLPKKMRIRKFEADGRTGHGLAWQDIAYVLEKITNSSDLVRLRGDLDSHRDNSLEIELKRWRNKLTIDRKRWDLEPTTDNPKLWGVVKTIAAVEAPVLFIGFKYFDFGVFGLRSKCISILNLDTHHQS